MTRPTSTLWLTVALLLAGPVAAEPPPAAHQRSTVQGVAARATGEVIHLRWQPLPGSDGYRVHCRAETGGYAWTEQFDLPAQPTAYDHHGVQPGTTYTFSVSAMRHGRASPPSVPVTATTAKRVAPSDNAP